MFKVRKYITKLLGPILVALAAMIVMGAPALTTADAQGGNMPLPAAASPSALPMEGGPVLDHLHMDGDSSLCSMVGTQPVTFTVDDGGLNDAVCLTFAKGTTYNMVATGSLTLVDGYRVNATSLYATECCTTGPTAYGEGVKVQYSMDAKGYYGFNSSPLTNFFTGPTVSGDGPISMTLTNLPKIQTFRFFSGPAREGEITFTVKATS